jgi:YD repeat-containing protein
LGNRVREDNHDPAGALKYTHARVYANRNRLLQDVGGMGQTTAYGYDAQGNLTARIDPFTQDGVTLAQYRYDYQGRRVKKTLGSQRTFYHYDQAGHLLAETDAQGATLKEHAYLEDLPLAMITPSGIYYYHTDHWVPRSS